MGPGSFIWEGFVDPETKLSVYSIELARLPVLGGSHVYGYKADDQIPTNITFGSANDGNYQGQTYAY